MALLRLLVAAVLFTALSTFSIQAFAGLITSPFISEFHYDNTGADVGEFVEISTPLDFDLSGWKLELYNGSNGLVYKSYSFGNEAINDISGQGATAVAEIAGIQNSIEGIALVNNLDELIQFISYEGSFVANNGAAIGVISLDILVEESGFTEVGSSIQYLDNTWTTGSENTKSKLNMPSQPTSVPEPSMAIYLLVGFMILFFRNKNIFG